MALKQQSVPDQEQQPESTPGRPAVLCGSPASCTPRKFQPVRWLLKTLGPGLITGASDDDPSGIGTYSMAGASLGYTPLWLAPATFPLMASVQYICAKIGLVCGCGIAGVIRRHYSRKVLYAVVLVLLVANTINAAADLGAIAAGVNLLVPIPISWLILPVGLSILALQIWGSYRLIARVFKWLALTTLAYVGAAFFARPDWPDVLRGSLVPSLAFNRTYLMMLVAVLGTTISPYLFFWQASQEAEEKASTGRKRLWRRRATDADLEYAFWDVNIGMLLSNVVMYFIILTTAARLHRAGVTDIETAAQAAEALRPLAGDQAFLLMACGLIGTGVLTVPILTGSGAYAVAEAFGWKCSLDDKPARAKEFYLVMAACTAVALAIDFAGIPPVKALFWTAVINGFLAPPLLVFIMLIANNRKIMGQRANGLALNVLGWLTTALMFAAALALLVTGGG
jgi:NRAMP (natural resistance-associated macrophage protein)-like metal ion transporter